MRKLVLFNNLAPGDVIVMTAAIRDLHRKYPGEFQVQTHTTCQDIWKANPNVTQFVGIDATRVEEHLLTIAKEGKPGCRNKTDIDAARKAIKDLARQTGIEFHRLNYGLINRSNQLNKHFINGYIYDLNQKLNLQVSLTELKPDLHLSEDEKLYKTIAGRYWVILSGGKFDFTAKWWGAEPGTVRKWQPSPKLWQEVVDRLYGKVQFVQVGPSNSHDHWHPKLNNVIDLRGKTKVRGLIPLIYHAEGVVCPVTQTMHIAAAFNKPCVIVAGGREPFWWNDYHKRSHEVNVGKEASPDYVSQKYLHTLGKLECCKYYGCWRSGIGEKKKSNCRTLVKHGGLWIPQCMAMITPEMVAESVLDYTKGLDIPSNSFEKLPACNAVPVEVQSTKPALGPFTLAVCLYGKGKLENGKDKTGVVFNTYEDMHTRLIESIRKFVPRNACELRVGLNDVSDHTLGVLKERLGDHVSDMLLYPGGNIRKYPRMREMFAEPFSTDWVIWMDDDSAFSSYNWQTELDREMRSRPKIANWGKIYYWRPMPGQEEWVRGASWYRGKPFHIYRGKPSIFFTTGGWWAIQSRVLREADWPDPRLGHNGGDVMLGEAVRQLGYEMANFDAGIIISGCARRGISEVPAGAAVTERGKS